MKRIISLLLILVVLTGSLYIAYASDDISEQKKIDTIFVEQTAALKAYERITEEKDKDNIKYENIYAGSYINEDGTLTLSLASNDKKTKDHLKNVSEYKNLKVVYVKHSYSDLKKTMSEIEKVSNDLNAIGIKVVMLALSERDNTVFVSLLNLNEEMKAYLVKRFGDTITVLAATELVETTATNIINGKALTINGEAGTIGFGATKLKYVGGSFIQVNGIVSVGHYINMAIGNTAYYGDVACGTVLASTYSNNSNCDSSFIETYSSFSPTNQVHNTGNIIGTTTAIQGLFVRFVGKESGVKYGNILSASVNILNDDGTKLLDTIEVNFLTKKGDSGGPLVAPLGISYTTSGQLLGISASRSLSLNTSYYSKVENIINKLGLTSIKTN